MKFTREAINAAHVDMKLGEQLLRTIAVNVENNRLSDADFREFVKNSLPTAMSDPKGPSGDGSVGLYGSGAEPYR